jgi:hypothetical protein
MANEPEKAVNLLWAVDESPSSSFANACGALLRFALYHSGWMGFRAVMINTASLR